jgi:transcriptional regulator of acetoin/glycerol metabolism
MGSSPLYSFGAVVSPQRSHAKGTNWLDEKLKVGFSLSRIRFIIATSGLICSANGRDGAESGIGREGMKETGIPAEFRLVHIVGESDALRSGPDDIEMVAPADRTVPIYGETGTGKELIARAVHDLSPAHAFVRLELCRHSGLLSRERALRARERRLHSSHCSRGKPLRTGASGTTFLDEIGELSLELQVAKDRLARRESGE